MAAFEYKALDGKGRNKSGVLEGDSARQVRQLLREQGLTPRGERDHREGQTGGEPLRAVSPWCLHRRTGPHHPPAGDPGGAGLTIEEALKAVAEQCEKAHLRSLVATVRSKVVEGILWPIRWGLPHVFDQLFRSMVAAGEKSGHLEKVLNRLADYTEQRQHMRTKLLQAMIYPIVLTLVAVGSSPYCSPPWCPGGGPVRTHGPATAGHHPFHRHQRAVAALRPLVPAAPWHWRPDLALVADRRQASSSLAPGDTAPAGDRSGQPRSQHRPLCPHPEHPQRQRRPLLEGMKIAGEVLSNDYARMRIGEATERVREGTSLRKSLDETRIFPPMMLHMIASGEQSGELDSMLERAADNQDREFETQVNIALGVFEPMLVVSMAGVVLFIVMSILQPILELNNMVNCEAGVRVTSVDPRSTRSSSTIW